MIYKTSSFERHKEGQRLIDENHPLVNKSFLAMLLFAILIVILIGRYNANLYVMFIIIIPTIVSFKYTTLHGHGVRLKRTAIETFGSDEEEYECRI